MKNSPWIHKNMSHYEDMWGAERVGEMVHVDAYMDSMY